MWIGETSLGHRMLYMVALRVGSMLLRLKYTGPFAPGCSICPMLEENPPIKSNHNLISLCVALRFGNGNHKCRPVPAKLLRLSLAEYWICRKYQCRRTASVDNG